MSQKRHVAPSPSAIPVDISSNPRIPLLMDMVQAMSRAQDPRDVLDVFIATMRRAYGAHCYVALSTAGLNPGEFRITRWNTPDGTERVGPSELAAGEQPAHTGGFFGNLVAAAEPKLLHHLSIRGDPVVGDALSEFGSAMAVPIMGNGVAVNWAVLLDREQQAFTVDDIEQMVLRANLIGMAAINARVNQELRDAHAVILREIDHIAAIQRSMLPEPMPRVPGVKLAASYATFGRAGGDYYDVIPLRRLPDGMRDLEGPWGILIADASGHGPSAAVVVAMLHSMMHTFPHEPRGPAEVLHHFNRHLVTKSVNGSFVTAFFGIYEPGEARLTYARAGHNPPLIKNVGAHGPLIKLDEAGGLPLGIVDDFAGDEATVSLEPGQTLVLYTDGVVEEVGPDGTQFGMDGLERALDRCSGEADCVIQTVGDELRRHQSWTRPEDDQTLVAMQIVSQPQSQ